MTQVKSLQSLQENVSIESKPKAYRFDVFKGVKDEQGKIHKLKSIGSAHIIDGCKTYTIHIKTFLSDVFYLLPETKRPEEADYVILTREPSQQSGRKYFWNSIGEGKLLTGENSCLVNLIWDVLGVDDIYLNLYPKETPTELNNEKILLAV